uniref:Huntingtin interacting protein 1 related n=1 Tax=Phasianus colchicus TaxID=9054 RepID=A0A669PCZ2_PHACC
SSCGTSSIWQVPPLSARVSPSWQSFDQGEVGPKGCGTADTTLLLPQAISISKAINTQEAPVKEKHARRIILGTHHEKGAFTFWSYAIGLPLPSSSILSWKFCHVLHKVLRDGHPNVLQDCQRYRSNIREGHLHDRYGQLVSIYTRLLLTKISFHAKHPEFPAGLEVSDEVLEKTAGTDVNNIFQLTVELFDYLDCELKLSESVFRQLNTSMAVSQMSAVQCRLAPLIQVIQDCSHLYHYAVKLMFKLHSCLPADTLQGHRDRFHEQFRSLKNFFKKASDMLYFKRLIQIPRLPESPPNFLRASALAEHVKPVVVIPEEAPEDEEPENLIEISTASTTEPQVKGDTGMGWGHGGEETSAVPKSQPGGILGGCPQAQRYVTQLKAQVNSLEGEVEEQRKQKQKALVDNEQLRDELERLQQAKHDSERSLRLCAEAEKKASATEIRYTKLKEKHSELINTHAELLRKVTLHRAQVIPSSPHHCCWCVPMSSFMEPPASWGGVTTKLLGAFVGWQCPGLSVSDCVPLTDAAALVGALALFAHLTADTIVNGSATSHLAPTDHELRPKSLDIKQEELGDMVEKEMASTSAAIEDAVRRIEDMMSRARNESSGIKLEVNERLLVMTSTNLQKEIVESGRGAATTQEFYAKNSRWTEGLISASKAVGWGATQLVESADRVVLQTGKYEELIVCSHEIAASTAQLVAASKVKAEKSSRNLGKLQECSRNVNEMAANVVASTRSGQEQIEDKDTMDFSGMSLIKLKKEEMETQVKVLELEKCLEGERVRLGELRKQHYALAGPYDVAEDGEARPAPAPRRGILKKPALAQKPGHIPGPGGEVGAAGCEHRAGDTAVLQEP